MLFQFAELVEKGYDKAKFDIAEWKNKSKGQRLFKMLNKMSSQSEEENARLNMSRSVSFDSAIYGVKVSRYSSGPHTHR